MRDLNLDSKIYQYIKDNEQNNINSIDIGCAILPYENKDMEDIMDSLIYMQDDAKIARVPNGLKYKYITI